jgi:hypothetical protein
MLASAALDKLEIRCEPVRESIVICGFLGEVKEDFCASVSSFGVLALAV